MAERNEADRETWVNSQVAMLVRNISEAYRIPTLQASMMVAQGAILASYQAGNEDMQSMLLSGEPESAPMSGPVYTYPDDPGFQALVESIKNTGDKRPIQVVSDRHDKRERDAQREENIPFDRHAICEAYYWYAINYHSGQDSRWYAVLGRLEKIKFYPGSAIESGRLDPIAQAVYDRLVRMHAPESIVPMPINSWPKGRGSN